MNLCQCQASNEIKLPLIPETHDDFVVTTNEQEKSVMFDQTLLYNINYSILRS